MKNGYLIQDAGCPNTMLRQFLSFPYDGMCAFFADALCGRKTEPCVRQLRDACFDAPPDAETDDCPFPGIRSFVTSPAHLAAYLDACFVYDVSVRCLFLESGYICEQWATLAPDGELLGFEVCPMLVDEQIIGDLSWYPDFADFRARLNRHGLFPTREDAEAFRAAYIPHIVTGELGDGLTSEEVFVFRVTEVPTGRIG